MRRPRVLIFDDDASVLDMLTSFFSRKGYEVLSYAEPLICPLYDRCLDTCDKVDPCADMIITDFQMPKMNGVQLLKAQTERGCKIDIRNKAVISGYIDGSNNHIMDTLGCSYFSKPFQFKELSGWLADCEKRIDLSQPVGNLS